MAGMSIENIGGVLQDGNLSRIMEHGSKVEAPVSPQAENDASAVGGSFSNMLQKSLDKVNELQLQADRAAQELVAGRNKNIHETMLMMEKADMSFRMMMQVRNKVIEAYREIMRMQV